MINNHHLTSHAKIRMQQRGVRDQDMAFVLATASQISPDSYILTKQDVVREVSRRKHEINQLERLQGLKLVIANGAVITCYRPNTANKNRSFRRGRTTR